MAKRKSDFDIGAQELRVRAALEIRARDAARELPSILYRFRSCNTPYFEDELKRLVVKNEAYFPSRVQLNDPVDSLPIIEKGVTFQEFSSKIVPLFNWIQNESMKEFVLNGDLSNKERRLVNRTLNNLPDAYHRGLFDEGLSTYIREKLLDEIGVLSLTDSNDNLVMWSTYSSGMNGVCVAIEGYKTGTFDTTPTKIRYVEERPRLNYWGLVSFLVASNPKCIPRIPKRYQQYLLEHAHQMESYNHKHIKWSYESEFRLAKFHGGGRYHSLLPGRVKEIYIGQKVAHRTHELIVEIAKDADVNVYHAHIKEDSYGITLIRIV